MKTYRIGVDKIPAGVGGIAFFENVREGTWPVAAYEAIGYRGGDFFIDHETTRESGAFTYPVYEVLTPAQFAEKYPQDVEDPMPVVAYTRPRTQEEKQRQDEAFVRRDLSEHNTPKLLVQFAEQVNGQWDSEAKRVTVKS